MAPEPTVFVVDDDPGMRGSLRWLIESVGLRVKVFESAREFLAAYDPERPGCVVLDVRMPGMSGLELHEELSSMHGAVPAIIITGHGDVPMAVRAMKAGAVDFLEKPFGDQVLLDCIRKAIRQDATSRRERAQRAEAAARLMRLTPREHEVMSLVVAGKANKQVAAELGLSEKTIEAHRARVMEKTQSDSLAELVQLAVVAGCAPAIEQ
ncbi:MAG: response regulator transcription factor [Planctomycetes bacterium]|nr:response regulator transcription factor [Planctomycetota bacterium]